MSVGILTGATLPWGHSPCPEGSLCILAQGTGAEPHLAAEQPGAVQSSVGSWEFPFPREETAPILSLAGAKDIDFSCSLLFFFFPDESNLTTPLQKSCRVQPGREEVTASRLLGQSPRKQREHARIFHSGAVSSVLPAHGESTGVFHHPQHPRGTAAPLSSCSHPLHCSLCPVHIQLPVRPEPATPALCLPR